MYSLMKTMKKTTHENIFGEILTHFEMSNFLRLAKFREDPINIVIREGFSG